MKCLKGSKDAAPTAHRRRPGLYIDWRPVFPLRNDSRYSILAVTVGHEGGKMIYKHRYGNLAMQEYDCYAGAASIVSTLRKDIQNASKREQAMMLLLICSIEADRRLLEYMRVTH